YRVARCYLEGTGVPASRAEALHWLKRAAIHDHVEAQSLLAALYLQGFGAREDAEGGSADRTGESLFAEEVGAPDYASAARWARRAAEANSPDGQAIYACILSSGPESMRDPEAAHLWYERSARGNSAQGALGYGLSLAKRVKDEDGQR